MKDDLISRQAAIDAAIEAINEWGGGWDAEREARDAINALPSAQPERLTDDDFETIRIHLNAYKEKLCNQQRWKEAEEYQRIINRFMSFASAQPEPQWIPVKTRPMTDEERDYWSNRYGYDVECEDAVMFDCKMPEDNQPVWVQSQSGYVYEDVCENDDGMIGLEGNGDWSDIVAWMPKYVPEPWKGEQNE